MFVIYCLVWDNPGTTMYIGSTKDRDKRLRSHSNDLRLGVHPNLWMQNLWDKGYEYEEIILEVVEGNRDEMLDREQEWIDTFDCIKSLDFANLQEARGGSSVTARKVVAVSKEGGVQYFDSLTGASKSLGVAVCTISAICLGKQKTAREYQFFYEEYYSPDKVDQELLENWKLKRNCKRPGNNRSVVLICRDTAKITEHDSRTDAAKYLGVKHCHISRAIAGNDPTRPFVKNHVAYDKEEWDESASFFYDAA